VGRPARAEARSGVGASTRPPDARALLDGARACVDTCEVFSFAATLPESCVEVFQCAVALPPDADTATLLAVARALDAEKRACGECAQAACRPPSELDARCVDGRCEVVPREPEPSAPATPARGSP
jgi:hypothetical protein